MSETMPNEHRQLDVHDHADHVEITGLSKADVVEALKLWEAAVGQQEQSIDALRTQVTQAMVEARMPLIPEPVQRQIQRAAVLRESLLEHGYDTYESLAEKRDVKESSIRTWATRGRREQRLFTVQVGGQSIVPEVQLTEGGEIREEVAALVTPLLQAGLDRWSLWAWLCTPTGWLSGEVPAEVARTSPHRAQNAAVRYAQQIADTAAGIA